MQAAFKRSERLESPTADRIEKLTHHAFLTPIAPDTIVLARKPSETAAVGDGV